MEFGRVDAFAGLARSAACRQLRLLDIDSSLDSECVETFTAKWFLNPMQPPIWSLPPARCRAILYRSAHNHIVDCLRAHARMTRFEGLRLDDVKNLHCSLAPSGRYSGVTLPEVCADRRQFWRLIESAIASLPTSQSDLLRRHLEHASSEEIAFELNSSVHAAKQRLSYARKRLRAALMARGLTYLELRALVALPGPPAFAKRCVTC